MYRGQNRPGTYTTTGHSQAWLTQKNKQNRKENKDTQSYMENPTHVKPQESSNFKYHYLRECTKRHKAP